MSGGGWIWEERKIVRKHLLGSERAQNSMMHIPRIRHICFELSMTSFNPSCRLSSLPGAFIKAERRKQIDGSRAGGKWRLKQGQTQSLFMFKNTGNNQKMCV